MAIINETALAELNDDLLGRVSLLARRERWLLLKVAPVPHGHRTVASLLFAVYRDADAAEEAGKQVRQGLAHVLRHALAAVADPDLALGDLGVDVFGDRGHLPVPVLQALEAVRGQGFVMRGRRVAPRDLTDASCPWLTAEPNPADAVSYDDAHQQYFRLEHGGVLVCIVDANGMKWAKAARAVLLDGAAGPLSETEVYEREDVYRRVPLPATYTPDGSEVKAKKRRPGTAPVTAQTRADYHAVLASLGAPLADHPLPDTDAAARKLVLVLRDRRDALKAAGTLPPTAKQVQYAAKVARILGLADDFDASKASRREVEAFLDEHAAQAAGLEDPLVVAQRNQFVLRILTAIADAPRDARAIADQLDGAKVGDIRNALEGWKESLLARGLVDRVVEMVGRTKRVRYAITPAGAELLAGRSRQVERTT